MRILRTLGRIRDGNQSKSWKRKQPREITIDPQICSGTDSYPVFLTVTDIRPEAGRTTEVQRCCSPSLCQPSQSFFQSCRPCEEPRSSPRAGERYCTQSKFTSSPVLVNSFLASIIHTVAETLYRSDFPHIWWDTLWEKHCGTRGLAGGSFKSTGCLEIQPFITYFKTNNPGIRMENSS